MVDEEPLELCRPSLPRRHGRPDPGRRGGREDWRARGASIRLRLAGQRGDVAVSRQDPVRATRPAQGQGQESPEGEGLGGVCFRPPGGSKFAPVEIGKIAARIAAARLLGNGRTPDLLGPDDEFVCSEFVARAYEHASLPVPWDGLGFIAPSRTSPNDPHVHPVAQADVAHPPKRFRSSGQARRSPRR